VINSSNEWSKLRKVVVGSATGARIPAMDTSLRTVNYANLTTVDHVRPGLYPNRVIDEANEDLESLCQFLVGQDVEVVRPLEYDPEYYHYCPRDTVLVHGNRSIATPMSLAARSDEWRSLSQHLPGLELAPNQQGDSLYDQSCLGNPNRLALRELAPKFDAANIIRANDDLLYLVSNSGNIAGAKWLAENLGPAAKVHLLQGVYSYMHIDSTVAFLRQGLMLCNPARIKTKDQLPTAFRSWDVIWCADPVDIGHYPGYCNASEWINMNLFSISPDLVVLEEHQHPLRKQLESQGINCAMLSMRHQRTLGGGFHCVTLDLVRDA
jgi:N-dimethylarginine dimethylaminohydrolase